MDLTSKILVVIITLLSGHCKCEDNRMILQGRVDGVEKGTVYLSRLVNERTIVTLDSAKILNHEFTFERMLSSPELFLISIEGVGLKGIFLENRAIQCIINKEGKMTVIGSSNHEKYLAYRAGLKEIDTEIEGLSKNQSDAEHNALLMKLLAQKRLFMSAFFTKEQKNFFGTFLAYSFIDEKTDAETIDSLILQCAVEFHQTKYISKMRERAELVRPLSIGRQAPDFTLASYSGEKLSLSSLKGKMVLLDFWASWCGPCRSANRSYVKPYHDFKEKGFEILSVSADTDSTLWGNAIRNDGAGWVHVSDLKGMKGEVLQQYCVELLPITFLLDRNGKIIARNPTPADIQMLLAKYLN